MSLNAHTIISSSKTSFIPAPRKEQNEQEKPSLSSFKEFLQSKGLIDETFTLLYNPIAFPKIIKHQELEAVLKDPIDYVFKDKQIPLTEQSWLEKIHKEFPTVQFSLRGSRAARAVSPVDQFEVLILSFAQSQHAPDIVEAWQLFKKTIPHPPAPNDTDWLGKVKGLSSERILNRLVHVMADLTKTSHDEIHQHGFQEKAVAHVSRFVRSEGNFAIASIGKEKKADILIGKLKDPYLFQRDCFFIHFDQDWNPQIAKRKYFWQAIVDRVFGIVRLEARHIDNFYCFLAAIEMKTKGCLIIEEETTLDDLLTPYRDLPIEQLADKIVKRIENHHIDPFCYLFNTCCFFRLRSEQLWKALLPRFQNWLSTKFHLYSWKIYTLILANRISFAEAEHVISKELIRSPGFLPLFPRQQGKLNDLRTPLDKLFEKEADFTTLETRGPKTPYAAANLFHMWIKGNLDVHDERRLSQACNIPEGSVLSGLRRLMTTDLHQSAFPFYMSLLTKLPPENLFQELKIALQHTTHWDLLFDAIKHLLSNEQQAELICNKFTNLSERLLKLLQEGQFVAFEAHFDLNSVTESEANALLKAMPEVLSDSLKWIKMQIDGKFHRLTIDDLLKETQRFKEKKNPHVRNFLLLILNQNDWVSRPDIYPLIISQGFIPEEDEVNKLIAQVESSPTTSFNNLLDVLKILSFVRSRSSKQEMRLLIQWIIDHQFIDASNGHVLWPYVLDCDFKNPTVLHQLISPGKELYCLKQWIQLYRKKPDSALRKALLMHLKDHLRFLIELTILKVDGELRFDKFLLPQSSDDPETRDFLLKITDHFLVIKSSCFVGLSLLNSLSEHPSIEEKERIVRMYLRFIHALPKKLTLPVCSTEILDCLSEKFTSWEISFPLRHEIVFTEFGLHPVPNMQVLAGFWGITLCDSKEFELTLPEIESVFHFPVRYLDRFLLCYFRSHQFQTKISQQRKFEFLAESLDGLIRFEKDLAARASAIAEILIASKCAFCESTPKALQTQVYDAIFQQMQLCIEQKKIDKFQELFYAHLWFSSSKTLLDFEALSILEPGFFYLRTQLTENELTLLDEISTNCLENLLTIVKKPECLEAFATFLIEYFLLLIKRPRMNDKHDNLIDIAVPVLVFLNTSSEKLDHFLSLALQQGYFAEGSWQRIFYMLIAKKPFDMATQTLDETQKSILYFALRDYLICIKKMPLVTTATISQCAAILNYMIHCNMMLEDEQFFLGIDALNHIIYQFMAIVNKEEGDRFIKFSMHLFMKYAHHTNQKNAESPLFLRMKAFLKKAKALQAIGPLPTDKNRKYNIIYIN